MKMIDGCVSREDADKINRMQRIIRDGFIIGLGGFDDENGINYKTFDQIYSRTDFREALDTLQEVYLMLLGLDNSRYSQLIKLPDVKTLAEQRVVVDDKGFIGDFGVISGDMRDRKSLYKLAIEYELKWLKEKVEEE